MAPPRTMHWFRWYHGTANDVKLRRIATQADTSVANVIAIWAMILESASEHIERGMIGSWDAEDVAFTLGIDGQIVLRVVSAMDGKVITGQRVTNWHKRQPKREKPDSGITDTSEHIGTHGRKSGRMGPRGEERRGEKKRVTTKTTSSAPSSSTPDAKPDLPKNWVVQFATDYTDATEGHIPPGELGRALKPLIAVHGHEETRSRWNVFIRHADVRYGAPYFAKHFGTYKPGGDLIGVGGNEAEVIDYLGLNR